MAGGETGGAWGGGWLASASGGYVVITGRLRIFAPSPAELRAFRDGGRDALAARLGVAVPADWPVFAETVDVPARSDQANPWGTCWGIHTADATLAVEGGLSTPVAEGRAVFGYADRKSVV